LSNSQHNVFSAVTRGAHDTDQPATVSGRMVTS
jgi:hypothetical protein